MISMKSQRLNKRGKGTMKKKSIQTAVFLVLLIIIFVNLKSPDEAVRNDEITLQNSKVVSTAYKQSFGLFDDISEPMWKRMQTTVQSKSLYDNPQKPLHGIENEKGWLLANMYPNFDCPHMERVGKGEGRKFLCYPHRLNHEERRDCLVYSIGCAGDFHFEDAMSKRYNKECEIHVFDPANWERPNDIKNRNIHYHAWGLTSTYDKTSKSVVWPKGYGGKYKTFPETLEVLGHQNRIIDLFKIDCEGCEWSTHKDWIGFGFRQIVMEIHGVPQPKGGNGRWYQKPMNVTDYFEDFKKNGYVLFNKDVNGDLALELAFLKLDKDFFT